MSSKENVSQNLKIFKRTTKEETGYSKKTSDNEGKFTGIITKVHINTTLASYIHNILKSGDFK